MSNPTPNILIIMSDPCMKKIIINVKFIDNFCKLLDP